MSDRLEERIRRGDEVREIVQADDGLIHNAFVSMQEIYKADWAGTLPEEAAKREALYVKLRALRDVESSLAAMIQDGRMAREELLRKQKQRGI